MYPLLLIHTKSIIKSHEFAEDIVQDAFCIACEKADDLLSSRNGKGWIKKTLRNVIGNSIKRQERRRKWEDPYLLLDDIPFGFPANSFDIDLKIMLYDILGEKDYTLLTLVVLRKYTIVDAANELGISVEVCKKRIQRAKTKAKRLLG